MDLVDGLRAFVATAQTGSFTAAAEQMGISNRLTSKYVGALEAQLGVRLFQRTTRKVGLTAAGEDLMARAPALIDELDDMLAEVTEDTRGFTGTIRISAPVILGETYVNGMLGRFAALHPDLSIDLRLTDRFSDLASEGIDLAFRIGTSETLSVKARKLGAVAGCVAASPAYLETHGRPAHPDDLAHHICILDTNRRSPARWVFRHGEREVAVPVSGRFMVNSARAACELAVNGQGIAYGPKFALHEAIEDGRLVPLLEDYAGEVSPISAVYLEGRTLPRKLRALIDFAQQDIRTAGVL
ncbi:LysR family transcriptional regulator [Tropicimonas sediminicola]|uniref:Transcriptional regulator, LysR family n=1 Tax=Tropicimonas sediminicola TaxID=1031541 RepID=A0A239EWJ2_9RHOB|nr:LysR family transcriptional regulator [Tropicimonas sediminicola]SNS48174.1 transcriptional regulator, LysR family [Tropicimonas sediminicola]